MAEKTTITVKESTLQRFRRLKAELDEQQDSVPDHTNNSFLESLLDTWEAAEDGYYDPSADEIVEELKNEISMANDPTVDVDVDKIINRIDDLESQLPPKIAEELK